jgi:uncharacterized membrane protein YhaH (DUF805 family)
MKWYLEVLKKYVQFEGRARRKEYWYFALFSALFSILLAVAGLALGLRWLQLAYSLAVTLPYLAVSVRRMHDVDKSGWFLLIPIYNLILALTPGTEGPNRFGPDPKRPEFEEILTDLEPS